MLWGMGEERAGGLPVSGEQPARGWGAGGGGGVQKCPVKLHRDDSQDGSLRGEPRQPP